MERDITVVGSIWFTEMGQDRPIGIVVIDNGREEKAYVGTGDGSDQFVDEIRVGLCGATFPYEVAVRLLGLHRKGCWSI